MFDPIILSIGPLFLPLTIIVLVLSVFIFVWLVERLSPEHEHVRRTVSDWLPTALLMALVVYKFGPALFNLQHVWQNPAMLLYMSGTDQSVAFAVLLAGGWLAWKAARSPSSWASADVLAVAGLLTAVVYNIVFKHYGETTSGWWGWGSGEYRYHPLHVYRLVLLVPLLVWVFRRWKQLAKGTVLYVVALWTGIVYMLTSFVDYSTGKLLFGLTFSQWAGVGLAVVGWMCKMVLDYKKNNEQNIPT